MLHSIDSLCTLFSIDRSTLRRWARELRIEPHRDATHSSRRVYTDAQVLALAQAHRRVVVVAQVLESRVSELEARVAGLEALVGARLATTGHAGQVDDRA